MYILKVLSLLLYFWEIELFSKFVPCDIYIDFPILIFRKLMACSHATLNLYHCLHFQYIQIHLNFASHSKCLNFDFPFLFFQKNFSNNMVISPDSLYSQAILEWLLSGCMSTFPPSPCHSPLTLCASHDSSFSGMSTASPIFLGFSHINFSPFLLLPSIFHHSTSIFVTIPSLSIKDWFILCPNSWSGSP